MHLISFDASPRQVSKLRNGHKVRIKKGSGFNLVVSPTNYSLVSRAFKKNKGVELSLSPEELDENEAMSPEQHEAMAETVDESLFTHKPFAEGGSIFKKVKKAFHSKTAKKIGRELRPLSRAMKATARDMAHEKIAEAHMAGAERYGSDPRYAELMNIGADIAHRNVEGPRTGGKLFGKIKKAFNSRTAKKIGRELRPLSRALKQTARDMAHEKIAEAHMAGAERYGDDPRYAAMMNMGADIAHRNVEGPRTAPHVYGHGVGADIGRQFWGGGLGAGCWGRGAGGSVGAGENVHDALRMANMATARANHLLAKMHNATVHGQLSQPPIKRYWDETGAPPSRGTGLFSHNIVRGRGSMLSADDVLPPALQSQPYGANFHMQFMLPPQYHKYNDGTDVEGRGLYT